MDCNCNKPNCIECFNLYTKSVKDYVDNKDLYYEAKDIIELSEIEDQVDIPDEILSLKDSWE